MNETIFTLFQNTDIRAAEQMRELLFNRKMELFDMVKDKSTLWQ